MKLKVGDWVRVKEGVFLAPDETAPNQVDLGGLYGQIVAIYDQGIYRVRLSANVMEMNFIDDELEPLTEG